MWCCNFVKICHQKILSNFQLCKKNVHKWWDWLGRVKPASFEFLVKGFINSGMGKSGEGQGRGLCWFHKCSSFSLSLCLQLTGKKQVAVVAWVGFQVFRFVCAENKKTPKKKRTKKESCCCECFVSCLLWTVKVESENKNIKKKRKNPQPAITEWTELTMEEVEFVPTCCNFWVCFVFLSPFCFLLLCWLMGGPIESSEKASASISWTQDHQGVCHAVALPFTLKSIINQKKNYGNLNISPWKKYNLKKISSQRYQNPSRYHNSITILKFQHKPKYHLLEILI